MPISHQEPFKKPSDPAKDMTEMRSVSTNQFYQKFRNFADDWGGKLRIICSRITLIGLATTIRNITPEKRAQAALQESEKRYSDLFENANDIVYTHDLAGNYTSVNKACERITGYTVEESLKMNVAQAVAPEYITIAKEMFARKAKENASSCSYRELEPNFRPR